MKCALKKNELAGLRAGNVIVLARRKRRYLETALKGAADRIDLLNEVHKMNNLKAC